MFVVKRDGRREPVMFDKITARIKKLCYSFDPAVIEPVIIAQKVIAGVFNGVTTVELDDLAAQTAAYMTTQHPDYARLAARIAVSNLHKMTDKSFAATMRKLHSYVDPKTSKPAALISDEVLEIVEENAERLDGTIVYDRDFEYDYFGFKTLERSYLLRMHGDPVERPQHMLMRVAIGIHKRDLDSVIETYNLMSERWCAPRGHARSARAPPHGAQGAGARKRSGGCGQPRPCAAACGPRAGGACAGVPWPARRVANRPARPSARSARRAGSRTRRRRCSTRARRSRRCRAASSCRCRRTRSSGSSRR